MRLKKLLRFMKKEIVIKLDILIEFLKSNLLRINRIFFYQVDGIVRCFYGMLERIRRFIQLLDR